MINNTHIIITTTTTTTTGGFQGGYSTARLYSERLNDNPRDIRICDIGDYCGFEDKNDSLRNFTMYEKGQILSNNVNG